MNKTIWYGCLNHQELSHKFHKEIFGSSNLRSLLYSNLIGGNDLTQTHS